MGLEHLLEISLGGVHARDERIEQQGPEGKVAQPLDGRLDRGSWIASS